MLSELLVVIAIMAILAGISFVGVSTYIRGLQALEMDETAKEMLIAAQNHLSSAYASGEYEEELRLARDGSSDESDFGTVISRPSYVNDVAGDKSGEHEYRVVIHTAASPKNKILNYMLPQFAIDNEVSENGNYMIVYEANSGTVLSVFYSGNAHTGFGGQSIYTFTASDVDDNAIKEAVESKAKRKNFTDNTVIGYFGGKNKDIIPGTKLLPLILSVSNGNKLTAIIQNPNFDSTVNADNSNQIVTLTVTGKTSGNYKTIQLTNDKRIEFDLDDITTPNKHFYDQFVVETHNTNETTSGPLIPGEDIELVAELSDRTRFANPVESNHVIDNSLFNSYNKYEGSSDGIAILSNIRHLENLDTSISNFSKAAKTGEPAINEIIAKQIADIDYADFVTDLGTTIYDGTNTSIQNYYGIYNTDLKEYDGTNHVIKNINSTGGNGGNSGIIGTVDRTGENINFRMKNVDIVDCDFSASSGDAGSAVGLASTPITFEYVNVKGADNTKTINISAGMGGVNAGGGLIGRTTDTLTVNRSYVSSDKLNILGNNSGGIVGYAVAACTITDSYVEGKDFNPVGNTSGGLVGKSDTDLTISKCHVSGENLNVAGNVAGGIAGLTTGKVDIRDTYSTAYVYADVEPGGDTGGGIAGGFIGSVDSPTSDSIIERCYVSGHTKNKNYATGTQSSRETASHVDNFNIIANGITGGFIGHSDAIAVKNSYTTASVYSSNYKNLTGSKIAGGFVGTCVNLSVNNVYSAGLVSVTEGGTVGGFAGTGTISATGSNYYLRGKDSAGNGFNDVPAVGSGGTLTGVSETAGTEISVTTAAVAERWDPELPKNYTYKTVAQLSGDNSSLNKHVGDWVVVTEDNRKKGIFIRNAEKLALVLKGNAFEGKTISVLVEGLTSKKSYYANYKLDNSGVTQNHTADGHATDIHESLLNYNFKTKDGQYEYYIFYDDITKAKGSFHQIFDCMKEGEDIRITAMAGTAPYTSKELQSAQTNESSGAFVGITNSLFADGSFNSNYENADYYSDINPNYAIVDPALDKTAYSGTALITNFRHLQNLDDAVSNIKCGINVEKVKLCKDLYWNSYAQYGTEQVNHMPVQTTEEDEYFNDFITAINDDQNTSGQVVKIFKWNATNENNPLAADNSFYGIGRDEAYKLIEFDGQNHSINNVTIEPKGTSYVGIFREADFTSNKSFSIGNIKVNYPKVNGTSGDTGVLIGTVIGDHYLDFNAYNIEINYPVVNTTTGVAGGVIGKAYSKYNYQVYNINNIKVNYSDINCNSCDSAGGVIGRIIADDNFTFNATNINTLGCKVNAVSGNVAAVFGEIYIENNRKDPKFTIENVTSKDSVIITGNKDAGVLIGRLGGSNYLSSNACNSTIDISRCLIEDFAVVTKGAYSSSNPLFSSAGALFGAYYNKGKLRVDKVYSYGKNSLIKALGYFAEAGGLIGRAWYGNFNITNSGASTYVYAQQSAGGFIGDYKPQDSTNTSIIKDCFVGGHVSESTHDYIDSVAVDVSVNGNLTDILNNGDGGYNVWSQKNTGGFIGYLFGAGDATHVSTLPIEINDCFTTASVKAQGKGKETVEDHGTSAGGFIGLLQFTESIKFDSCYVAGRVFGDSNNTNNVGGFTGMNHLRQHSKPTYKNVSVLRGISFNESLLAINVDKNNGTDGYLNSESESIFVEADSPMIVNNNASSVWIKTFNMANVNEYPFKDNARGIVNEELGIGTDDCVFYGDWMIPRSSYVGLENGNRLTASIWLTKDKTYSVVTDASVPGGYYYETYIKLVGQTSGANTIYRVRYNDNNYKAIAQLDEWKNQVNIERYISMFDYLPNSSLLNFYIDDLSALKSDYLMTMSQGPENALPGEDVLVNVSNTFDGAKNLTGNNTQAVGNSLFESLDANGDGTYTAKIANSRNLQNLEVTVSGKQNETSTQVYKISRAVQTDNIYWKNDGSYKTTGYTAKVEPYITELSQVSSDSNVYIYQYNKDFKYTSSGKFRPIYVNDSYSLAEYDGGGYSIYNLNLDDHETAEHVSGLFGRTNKDFTVKNLTLINTVSDNIGNHEDGKSDSSGAVVGSAKQNLTLSNVHLKGVSTVTAKSNAGGFVGEVSGELKVENCGVNNFTTFDNRVTGELNVSCTGGSPRNIAGLVAKTNNKAIFTGCTIDCNTLNINDPDIVGSSYLGGFIAFASQGVEIASSKIDNTALNITTNNGSSSVGGIVGYAFGDVSIENTFVNSTNLKLEGRTHVGGVLAFHNGTDAFHNVHNLNVSNVGVTSANGSIINSRGYKLETISTALGGLIGYTNWANVNLQNCYSSVYLQGFSESVGGLIGNLNASSGVVNNCYASGHTTGGVFVDTIDENIVGRFNIISSGKYVGGFIGSLSGICTVEHCFNTNSVIFTPDSTDTSYDHYIGGFIGKVGSESSGELLINDCYSYSHLAGLSYANGSPSSVGAFVGQLYHNNSYHNASINNSYYLDEGTGLYPIVTRDGCEVGLAPVTKTDSANITATNETFTNNTVPFDATRTIKFYPFKNWISSKTFYGDWME